MKQGDISIHAQNMMPIIKRWLYSDKDIFIRELVSNGVDAITKYKLLCPGAEEDFRVTVQVDKEHGVLRFADNGIGMSADEVEKYINQVAFSGAEEFVKNYTGEEKGGIIGHFGLGFYSAFMVSDKVNILTRTYRDGENAVQWESADGMAFTMDDAEKDSHGTIITLTVSEEEKEFLEVSRVREVLEKYCGYMSVPVYLEDCNAKPETVPATDDQPETVKMPQPEQLNDTQPLWLKDPKACTDEEYKEFYKKMFHTWEEPLFWIHLNVDYPFNLKGILYFPKLNNDFGAREGEIKLFSGQVFVADNIKEIIPEFLMLLKGVIDCPDIPLNVSRSFLQNDGYVKKISTHITKKVADRLNGLFNTQRETYEGYWNDIAPFVKFGCIKNVKFLDSVKGSLLLQTTADKYLTLDEYAANNKEKANGKIYYTNDEERQAASIALYTAKGIDVAVLNTVIDMNWMSFMEYGSGLENIAFARVDADVDSLTQEDDTAPVLDTEALQALFRKAIGKENLTVKVSPLTDDTLPAIVTEDEQSRRFKDMSRAYGESFPMPDNFTLVLNNRCEAVRKLAERPDDETTQLLCKQIYDLARMSARPLEAAEITEFLTRSNKLLGMLM